MAIRKILRFGDEFLRGKAKDVHKVSRKIQDLVTDLLDTMYANNGVGLAAPQIGEDYRVFVVDVSTGDEPLNPIVFINPKIIKKSGATISREGCLSFPEAFTDVRRYSDIMVNLFYMFGYIVSLNVGLAVFNLLPIPPLDGSRVFSIFLKEDTYFNIMRYEQIIFLVLIVVMNVGILDTPIAKLQNVTLDVMDILTGFLGRLY